VADKTIKYPQTVFPRQWKSNVQYCSKWVYSQLPRWLGWTAILQTEWSSKCLQLQDIAQKPLNIPHHL